MLHFSWYSTAVAFITLLLLLMVTFRIPFVVSMGSVIMVIPATEGCSILRLPLRMMRKLAVFLVNSFPFSSTYTRSLAGTVSAVVFLFLSKAQIFLMESGEAAIQPG